MSALSKTQIEGHSALGGMSSIGTDRIHEGFEHTEWDIQFLGRAWREIGGEHGRLTSEGYKTKQF